MNPETKLHFLLLLINGIAFYYFLNQKSKSPFVVVPKMIYPVAIYVNFTVIFSDPKIQEALKQWDL